MAQEKVNKHGLVMDNLREVCAMTKGMRGGSSYHIEIAWDQDEGRILVEEHVGQVGDNRRNWNGAIFCGFLARPMTQQEIADQIYEVVTLTI